MSAGDLEREGVSLCEGETVPSDLIIRPDPRTSRPATVPVNAASGRCAHHTGDNSGCGHETNEDAGGELDCVQR